MKVLVVDDDVVSRMMLMHLIDSSGNYDIVEAEDGADAWRQLAAGLRPAVCFCDLRMPRLSGMELLHKVRADGELATLPFVLVSSANDRATVESASEAGATGYIVKPFDPPQVRRQLDALAAPAEAEEPAATLARLGIDAARLQAYLAGLEAQLAGAGSDLAALVARGESGEAAARLERLREGCRMLGLHGAAAALAAPAANMAGMAGMADTADTAALAAMLAAAGDAVRRQARRLRA